MDAKLWNDLTAHGAEKWDGCGTLQEIETIRLEAKYHDGSDILRNAHEGMLARVGLHQNGRANYLRFLAVEVKSRIGGSETPMDARVHDLVGSSARLWPARDREELATQGGRLHDHLMKDMGSGSKEIIEGFSESVMAISLSLGAQAPSWRHGVLQVWATDEEDIRTRHSEAVFIGHLPANRKEYDAIRTQRHTTTDDRSGIAYTFGNVPLGVQRDWTRVLEQERTFMHMSRVPRVDLAVSLLAMRKQGLASGHFTNGGEFLPWVRHILDDR